MSVCSVVMVSSRAGQMILAAVKSVLNQEELAELIVVDTGNPPHLLARLQQLTLVQPKLKIISGAGPIGHAKALNMGAEKATGDYIMLLGMDCLLPPGALGIFMKHMQASEGVKIAGPAVLSPSGRRKTTWRTKPYKPEAAFAEMFASRGVVDEKTETQLETPKKVEHVCGLCLCMRRSDFIECGGLDGGIAAAWDYDLCLRVRKAGGSILFLPDITVTHMQEATRKGQFTRTQLKSVTGSMRYFKKHYNDACAPGFLTLLTSVLWLRFFWRVGKHRLRRLFVPHSQMKHTVAAKRLMILASGLVELPQDKNWHGKTVLVTGATSQIGLSVLKHVISQGAAVLALSRDKAIPYQHDMLRWIKGDLTDPALDLQGYLIDAVVHCAPLWTLPDSMEKLADAEVKRIIAFGSTSMFSQALSGNTHEKDMVHKLQMAEENIGVLCRSLSINHTILRPTLTYGVGLDLGITSIAKIIDRWGVFLAYPPAAGRRQPVHTDDLARAVVLAMNHEESYGKAYNISGSEVLSYDQMLQKIFTVCQKKPRIYKTTLLPFILSVAGTVSRKKHLTGEIARRMNDDLIFFHDDARKDFGFSARPFLHGGLKDIEGF